MRVAAIIYESTYIYWDQIIVLLGAMISLCISLTLARGNGGTRRGMAVLLVFTAIISLYISRFLHWYFVGESYLSLMSALTDMTIGGFCVSGLVPGLLLAAAAVRFLGYGPCSLLADGAAPGLLFFMAFLRLGEHFAGICASSITVGWKAFQWLPFSMAVTDSAGNNTWRFATAPMSFLLFFSAGILSLILFYHHSDASAQDVRGSRGNTAALGMALGCCIEILMDSTRNDAVMIQFRFLEQFNKYVGFVSIGMIIPAAALITVYVKYLKAATGRDVKKSVRILTSIVFFLGVVIIAASEYLVQRYTSLTLSLRMLQTFGCILAMAGVCIIYRKLWVSNCTN